ncbi:Uncharacterised protein [Vibrio cholerae]|uniref:Uncharacterized protein n=1 Tax=Vibrio cholerae TaxID=666 RepID=A0A655YCH9_VIBCL|nr:Uncharacterised protein [Vibrio cholerae]CSB87642.1 Uncharacterised protein [Vibrio cholerae]CSC19258.1 Uncharacterised protein [Vibrio cholerae]CSC29298.1 Uncharacterised protein [Vibrio cholerae]CSC32303.1 Uncharacterised protein [Vibrio cholerae]
MNKLKHLIFEHHFTRRVGHIFTKAESIIVGHADFENIGTGRDILFQLLKTRNQVFTIFL